MNYLLDTHIAIWAFSGSKKLGKEIQNLLTSEENRIYYSIASLWEVAIKHKVKPDKIPVSAEEFLQYCMMSDFSKLSIRDSHIIEYERLPNVHSDPFDNIILAQALAEDMILITHDSVFKKFPDEYLDRIKFA